jgi:processive 1,2-diacylglycerol beta-glucosyltransferase
VKKILMPMVEAGSGHKMPALAVKEALDRLYPGSYEVRVIDFAKECGALESDKAIKGAWDIGLAHPLLARLGYRLADMFWPLSLKWPSVAYPDFLSHAVEYIRQYGPDLIFSTNYITATVSAHVKKSLGLQIPVMSFVTDPFDAFGWWVDPALDMICVASEVAQDQLLTRGIPASHTSVFQFPIHRKFLAASADPEALRNTLGLRPDVPTILTSEGGQGIGTISSYILKLHELDFPCNIVSVCGRNDALREELLRVAAARPSATNLVPLGFVDNMHELLELSDLCVAKAGASTTFEALLKGVPIIFASWATYNEKPNIDYCVDRGIGWFAPDFGSFKKTLDGLLVGDALKDAKQRIAELALHSGSDDIARFLHECVETGGIPA